ncbi:MAG: hypothetical protein K2X81_08875 [Candidatus Obscuribacterales bacterium]|nr:hypothetical protein [Candidatus Obscuribacterales bacterium]
MEFAQRVLEFIVGAVFVLGGGYISRCSLDSKNMIEVALFGLLGVSIGLFLIIACFMGAPGGN